MKNNGIPISFFKDVTSKHADLFECVEWPKLVDELASIAGEQMACKEAAPLMASAEFRDGRRLKDKALVSGMVILDVDHGATLEDALDTASELEMEAVFYTTASHRDDHHKFRVCVPLAANVKPTEYTMAWFGLNEVFGGIADSSKKGCESLFYLPGQYPNAPNRFEYLAGEIASAEEWAVAAPEPELDEARNVRLVKPVRSEWTAPNLTRRMAAGSFSMADYSSVFEHPLVSDAAADAYLDTFENWHHARFKFMCSVAGRAARRGYPLQVHELVDIFNALDLLDGGFYAKQPDQVALRGDAQRALDFATGTGGQG